MNEKKKLNSFSNKNIITKNGKIGQLSKLFSFFKNNNFIKKEKLKKLNLIEIAQNNLEKKNILKTKIKSKEKTFIMSPIKIKNKKNSFKKYSSYKNIYTENDKRYDEFVERKINKLKRENEKNIKNIKKIRKEIPKSDEDYFIIAMNYKKKKIISKPKKLFFIKNIFNNNINKNENTKNYHSLSLPAIRNFNNSRNKIINHNFSNYINLKSNPQFYGNNLNKQFSEFFILNKKNQSYKFKTERNGLNDKNLLTHINV